MVALTFLVMEDLISMPAPVLGQILGHKFSCKMVNRLTAAIPYGRGRRIGLRLQLELEMLTLISQFCMQTEMMQIPVMIGAQVRGHWVNLPQAPIHHQRLSQ